MSIFSPVGHIPRRARRTRSERTLTRTITIGVSEEDWRMYAERAREHGMTKTAFGRLAIHMAIRAWKGERNGKKT